MSRQTLTVMVGDDYAIDVYQTSGIIAGGGGGGWWPWTVWHGESRFTSGGTFSMEESMQEALDSIPLTRERSDQ